MTAETPYARAHEVYPHLGWAIIPSGRDKAGIPTGTTGRDGVVTHEKMDAWARTNAADNVAIRHTGETMGIDVDEYDDKHGAADLAKLVALLGPLPATWSSTARGRKTESRQHFFRIPVGVELAGKPPIEGQKNVDIEIIQRHHRYSLVWPSVHPKTGKTYHWYKPDGTRADGPPSVDMLPMLPQRWIDYLSRAASQFTIPEGAVEAEALVATFDTDGFCHHVTTRRAAVAKMRAEGHIGHDEAKDLLTNAFMLGREGCRGVPALLTDIAAGFFEYATKARGEQEAADEWSRLYGPGALKAQGKELERTCTDPQSLQALDLSSLEASIDKPVKVKVKKDKAAKKKHRDEPHPDPDDDEDETEDPNPILLVSLSELRNRPRPQWFIDGVLQQGTVAVLGGASGIGKTFLVLDMVGHMLHGMDWQGHATKRARVIYVAAEGVSSFGTRIGAWEQFYSAPWPEDAIAFVESGVSMREPESIKHLAQRLDQFECDLLVLDTLSQLSNINNENDNAEMAATIHVARLWQRRNPSSTVLLVHHVTKQTANDKGGKLRGGGSLKANADTVIMTQRAASGDWFEVTTDPEADGKQRDGAAVHITGLGLMDYAGSKIVHAIAGSSPEELRGRRISAIDSVLADGKEHGKADFVDALIEAGLLTDGSSNVDIEPEWNNVRSNLRDLVRRGTVEEVGASARTKKWRTAQKLGTLDA